MLPKLSFLLCTVRPDKSYANHADWHVLQKVVDDLNLQTFKDFDLVIVDGLRDVREWVPVATFPIKWISPTPSFWTRHKKVAISRYRNTGIAHCDGELIVNLDDCCELPPQYAAFFWLAWSKYNTCLSVIWPESGDSRRDGHVTPMAHRLHPSTLGEEIRPQPQVYGFGSYPRKVALEINGYNEWFDGAQGLEDFDWSTRLTQAGVKMALKAIPGFRIHAQSGHDPRAIDQAEPLVKCCNLAWWCARVWQQVLIANQPYEDNIAEALVGPCRLLEDGKCRHHLCSVGCGYLPKGFAAERHPLAWEGVQAERGGFRLEEFRR